MLNVGLLDGTDGLLGVAGMICLIISQWIIPSFPTKNNGFFGPIYLLRSHLAAVGISDKDSSPVCLVGNQ